MPVFLVIAGAVAYLSSLFFSKIGWRSTAKLPLDYEQRQLRGGGGLMTLFRTHPPLEERIRRLEEMASRRS